MAPQDPPLDPPLVCVCCCYLLTDLTFVPAALEQGDNRNHGNHSRWTEKRGRQESGREKVEEYEGKGDIDRESVHVHVCDVRERGVGGREREST